MSVSILLPARLPNCHRLICLQILELEDGGHSTGLLVVNVPPVSRVQGSILLVAGFLMNGCLQFGVGWRALFQAHWYCHLSPPPTPISKHQLIVIKVMMKAALAVMVPLKPEVETLALLSQRIPVQTKLVLLLVIRLKPEVTARQIFDF